MIIADTSAWIDYFRGIDAPHTDILDTALSKSRIGTGDLIIAELLQGFKNDTDYILARDIIDSLKYFDMVGREVALSASQYYRTLRKEGVTVRKTVDILIATFCILNDFELIHNYRDFEPFEKRFGLRVRR